MNRATPFTFSLVNCILAHCVSSIYVIILLLRAEVDDRSCKAPPWYPFCAPTRQQTPFPGCHLGLVVSHSQTPNFNFFASFFWEMLCIQLCLLSLPMCLISLLSLPTSNILSDCYANQTF